MWRGPRLDLPVGLPDHSGMKAFIVAVPALLFCQATVAQNAAAVIQNYYGPGGKNYGQLGNVATATPPLLQALPALTSCAGRSKGGRPRRRGR